MSIDVSWINDDRSILLWEFKEGWTFEHFRTATGRTSAMVNKVDTIFDLILNMDHQPPPFPPIGEFRKAIEYNNPRWNRLVLVNSTFFYKMILEMFCRTGILSTRLHSLSANSVEEAMLMLIDAPDKTSLVQ